MNDLSLEHDDDLLTYGSPQELRHLVNGILGRVAIRSDSPLKDIAHSLLDALRLGYRDRFLLEKSLRSNDKLRHTIQKLKGEKHGPN